MKYKLKDSYKGIYNRQFEKGEIIDSNDEFTGIVIEIPFTDTRFFEPVKTRKFVIEVDEDKAKDFQRIVKCSWIKVNACPTWIDDYKSSKAYNTDAFSIDQLYTIDVEEFKDDYQYGNKLQGVKWLKDRFGKGLRESKELADFIFAL